MGKLVKLFKTNPASFNNKNRLQKDTGLEGLSLGKFIHSFKQKWSNFFTYDARVTAKNHNKYTIAGYIATSN